MYDTLSRCYEELFPASDESISFLRGYCPAGGRVLDVACSTGEHARKLAERGYEVTGVDLDSQMIDLAGERSKTATFLVADMTGLEAALGPDVRFDLMYCIGNSVVHLPDRRAIGDFLQGAASLLVPGASIVLQIINFEPIRRGRLPDLPTLFSRDRRISFARHYEITDSDHVAFVTSLEIDGTPTFSDSLPLVVLTKDQLSGLLGEAGYSDLGFFGGFDRSPWRSDSFVTIVSGRR